MDGENVYTHVQCTCTLYVNCHKYGMHHVCVTDLHKTRNPSLQLCIFFHQLPLPLTHSPHSYQLGRQSAFLGRTISHRLSGYRGVVNFLHSERQQTYMYMYMLYMHWVTSIFTSRPVCDIWLFAAKGVVVH